MNFLISELAMGFKRKKAVQQRVEAIIAQGRCLVPGCDRSFHEPGGGRGRCSKHFAAMRRELMNRPQDEQFAIQLRLQRKGELLAGHEIRDFKSTSRAS